MRPSRSKAKCGASSYFSADSLRNSSEPGYGSLNGGLGLPHMFFTRMRLARPEEAAQSVLFAARDNVHMQMRNALADLIIDGYERSLGFDGLFDGVRQKLYVGEEWPEQLGRQIRQRCIVRLGDQHRVANEERLVIQERNRKLVFEHNIVGV